MNKTFKYIIGLAVVMLAGITTQASDSVWQQMVNTGVAFIKNNPTNTYDVSTYAVVSQSDKYGYGAGARIGYWINPSVGAALDVNYCGNSWMFTSLGLAGRGTINLPPQATLGLYATAGAGWNWNNGASPTVAAVVGAGGTLHINNFDWFDLFGEYQHVTLSPDSQNRVLLGVTKRF